ncbi:RHS repeat-associated protein [Catenulispora sp. EB89]|uniref:toxin TcdB middle/N-terminal domain-containing protein n=1 Tax=Catenulispora sp. EB89 TaxID=3156257 RepID=UPI003517ED60
MTAADPTSEEILKLPPGGGAVTSSGTDFDIDLNTGTAGTSLPLHLPAGPNGVTPELSLRYHSGSGSDWLGLGWSLNLPRITLRRGRSADGSAAQPALDGVGALYPRIDSGWAPEVDSLGQRILGGPDTGWQLLDPADTVHALGSTAASRLTDGAGTTVAWLLDSVTDSTGNAVRYDWETSEATQPSGGNLRLSTVTWGRYLVRIVYEQRPDILTDGTLGVLLAIGARVAVIELHRPDLGSMSLLRSWHVGYDDAGGTGRSLLTSVAQTAHAADGTVLNGSTVTFRYTEPGKASLRVLPRLPVSVRQPGTQFVDLDGDGLPDLLDLSSARPQWWQNTGGGVFSGPHRPRALPSPVRMDPGSVTFADVDGDGAADLMVMTERFSGFYPLDAVGFNASGVRGTDPLAAPFGRPVSWRRAPSYRLDDRLLRILDLDGDGRSDILVQSGAQWLGWLQDAHAGWAALPVEIAASDRPAVDLSDPRVSFADINGDGGLDIVRVTGATLTYWPCLGPRRWGAPITVTIPSAPPRFDPSRLLLVDVDGDGCADVVYLDSARVLLWRWCGTRTLSGPTVVVGIPPTGPGHCRLLDLEGTGTPGLLLDLPDGKQGFIDLLGGKPYLLAEISDVGATTVMEWRTSTQFAADDAAAGHPWRTFHPFPVQCVAGVSTTNAATGVVTTTRYRYHEARYDPDARAFLGFARVDRDDVGDASAPTTRSTTAFHLGLDPTDPNRVLTDAERLRLGALRRRPLSVLVHDPVADPGATRPESVVRHTYDLVDRLLADSRHSFLPYTASTVEQRWEGNSAPVSTHTVTFLKVDGTGMVLEQRSVVQRPGLPADRDVTLTRQMATGGTNLRLPCRTLETDVDGVVLAHSLTFYDGPPEIGLPLGSATEGLITRVEDLVLTDAIVTAVWGSSPPDFSLHGYHRLPGEDGWWVARSRLNRDPAQPTILKSVSPMGAVGTTELDPTRHDVIAVTDSLGHRRTAQYDPRTGNVTTVVEFDGNARHESFDALGRVTAYWPATNPDGDPIAIWQYDTSAMPVRVTAVGAATADDPSRAVSFLDGSGATILRLTPTGDTARPWLAAGGKTVNARGWVSEAYLPYTVAGDTYAAPATSLPHSSFMYDLAGRLLSEARADGSTVTWTRAPGSATVSVRPDGSVTDRPKERHLVDACGQMLSVGRWDGARWVEQTYTWDHRGMPLTITTPDGIVNTLVHDLLGRMISHASPDSGLTRRLMDALGHEVRTEIATGAVVTREFDEIGRPTRLWRDGSSGSPDVTWEYLLPGAPTPSDGERHRIGRLWRVTDPLGTLTFGYDAAGRIVSKVRSGSHLAWDLVSEGEYDVDGRLTAVTLPAATSGGARRRVEYTHDELGRPVAATGVVDQVSFDVYGRTTDIRHSNGTVTSLRYDAVTGQVTGQKVVGPQGETLRDQAYDYDDEHRLVGIGIGGAGTEETGWSYGFDGLGRLASATPTDGGGGGGGATARAFTFSDGGNVLTGPLGDAQTYVAGTSRLATVAGNAYTYDAAGRITSAPWGDLTWDADDNLVEAVSGQTRVQHMYDHAGMRVLSMSNDVVYHFQPIDELVVSGDVTSLLIRFAGVVIASADAAGQLTWYHPDVLGDVTLLTDATGAASARVRLDPWGNKIAGTAAPGTGFLGQPADPTGLVCLGHRWYDPRTGRFISPDPLAGGLYTLGAWNPYSYGMNNPVLMCDPSGLTSIWAIIAIAVVVAIIVVLCVATCGAALAGVTILGCTIAADGVATGTLVAVGIGAFGGALAGGMSADKAGGDVMLGALLGGIIGGACALIGGAIGGAITAGLKGTATWAVYAISGGVQGAIGGFGSGFASGWAGGKGSLGDMMLSGVRGMIWGATIGMVVGGFLGGSFATSGEDHSYLEVGTFHKYGLGFAEGSKDLTSDFSIWDNSVGTAFDAGQAGAHAAAGSFSLGNDVAANVIDVTNIRNVGADLGFITTKIPGTLFAVDVSVIANAVGQNGLGAGLASLSVGADVAGFSYAQQVLMLLKAVPILGNLLPIFDDYGSLDGIKKGFNTFYGSSTVNS